MARWFVVTEGQDVPVSRVVWKVLGQELLAGGRVRWLVEAPDCAQGLPKCFRGFLSVEREPAGGRAPDLHRFNGRHAA